MRVEIDDDKYEQIALPFLIGLLKVIVRELHRHAAIDVHRMSKEDMDLVFNIAFFVAAQFETYNPVTVGGTEWFAHCMFAEHPQGPLLLIASSRRSVLHGKIEDDILTAAFEEVASET